MAKLSTRRLDKLRAQLQAVVKKRGKAPKYDDAAARRIQTACDEAGLGEALSRWAAAGCDYSVFSLDELKSLHGILCEATGQKNIFGGNK